MVKRRCVSAPAPGGDKSTSSGPSTYPPAILLRTALAQIVLKYLQDVRHIPPSQADTDMLVAVIEQRAGKQKHACTLKDFGTETLSPSALQTREGNRPCQRPAPFQNLVMPCEESIEDGEVVSDDRHIA